MNVIAVCFALALGLIILVQMILSNNDLKK